MSPESEAAATPAADAPVDPATPVVTVHGDAKGGWFAEVRDGLGNYLVHHPVEGLASDAEVEASALAAFAEKLAQEAQVKLADPATQATVTAALAAMEGKAQDIFAQIEAYFESFKQGASAHIQTLVADAVERINAEKAKLAPPAPAPQPDQTSTS